MFHVKLNPTPGALSAINVCAVLGSAGLESTEEQCERLVTHAELMLEANKHMNLTRIQEPAEVLHLHIADSLVFLPLIPALRCPVVDIGSGTGYPGVPLAIMGYDVVLCESATRKAAFLTSCVETLGLSCEVVNLRAEELAERRPAQSRTVVARALSSLPSLVELAAPLLRSQGVLIALKGSPQPDEVRRSEEAAVECGMRLTVTTRYALPSGEPRSVFVYEKVARPRLKLPRRPGMAQRHPLGIAGA